MEDNNIINKLQRTAKLLQAIIGKKAEVEGSELERQNNEGNRKAAEELRASAEQERVHQESTRNSYEEYRKSAETTRVNAETSRANAEAARVAAEASRAKAETSRVNAETAREAAETERVATITALDDRLEASQLAAKRAVVADMWASFSSGYITFGYNAATDRYRYYFNINDGESATYQLNDITYAQAVVAICRATNGLLSNDNYQDARVNLPPTGYHRGSGPVLDIINTPFVYDLNTEVCLLTGPDLRVTINKGSLTFTNCWILRAIIGIIQIWSYDATSAFKVESCPKLEYFRLSGLRANLNLSASPLLTVGTVEYLASHATGTSAVTVTVHPDVYAKLTGDTTNAAAAALSAEELARWQQIVSTATAKKVSFATL